MNVRSRTVAILFAVLVVASCASAPPTGPEAGKALVEESAASMGGWAAMDAVTGQEILTGGSDWEPMQAIKPGGDARLINSFGQTLLVDFPNKRMRLTFDALRSYPAPGPVKFTEIIDGNVAMLQTTDPQGKVTSERLHPSRLATRMRDLNRLPLRVLYVAKNAPDLTRLENQTVDSKVVHILKYTDGNMPVELQIDSFNKLPVRIIYKEDDPLYGDTLNEVAFSDWRENNGIRLPYSQSTFLNGVKIREERVRTLINNSSFEPASFTIPEEVRSQVEVGEPVVSQWTLRRAVMGVSFQDFARPQKVDLVQLSPGVWHVTGSSHHSLAVEMKDHIVVVEAPLFEERSLAVIKALEEKIPGKPIKYLVMTHFHMDHSGGVRAYAAKGATVLTHESNVDFLKEVMARAKTLRPDSLAGAGGANVAIEGVGGMKTLTDGERTMDLREIPNPHSTGMLAVYLPKEKLVFASDLYSPGNPVQVGDPNANALLMVLTAQNFAVDRMVGGHGGVGPFRDLAKVSGPVTKTGS